MKILKNLKTQIKKKKRAKWLGNCCKKFKNNKGSVKKLLITAAVLGLLFLFRGQFIVATVNGRPISRRQLRKTLEAQGGAQALQGLITESLISQEAANKGINVPDEEIDQEIEKIKESLTAQGQDFELLLQAQGIELKEVRKQIGVQKALEGLVDQDLEVSEEEIADYLEENKEFLPEDQEGLEEQVTETLRQDKLNQAIQELLTTLEEKANIKYWEEL